MRRGGWSRRKRNERKDEYPEEGGRLGVEGIVEGERVVGEDSRDGLFDLRSRLPSLRFQLFSSFLTIFLLLFFSSSRGGNCERERGGGKMKILQDRWKKKLSPRDVKDSFDIHTDATRRNM